MGKWQEQHLVNSSHAQTAYAKIIRLLILKGAPNTFGTRAPQFFERQTQTQTLLYVVKNPEIHWGTCTKASRHEKKKYIYTHIDVIHPHVLNNYNHIYIYLYNISIYTYTYHSYVLAATAAKRDSPQCAGNCFLPFTASTDAGRLRGLENPAELIGRCDSGGGFSGGKRSTDRPLWCWRHKKRHGTINGHPFYEHILNGDRRYSLEFVWISWYISYRYAANRFLFVFFFLRSFLEVMVIVLGNDDLSQPVRVAVKNGNFSVKTNISLFSTLISRVEKESMVDSLYT